MAKISLDVADKEVQAWLSHKKVSERTKEVNEDSIEELTAAVAEGTLLIDDSNFEITQNLQHQVGEEQVIAQFIYIPRVNDRMLAPYLKGVKPTDSDGRLIAYIAALTKQPKGIIKEIDSVDKKIALAIAVFFL